MSTVDDLVASLSTGNFDTVIDGLLDSMGKDELTQVMQDMDAKASSIADADLRHLFKNGIGSIKMTLDTM